MANSSIDRLVAVLINIMHEVLSSIKLPTITLDKDKLFLEELQQIRKDNATFQHQVVSELGELRRTIGSGLAALGSRHVPMETREIALWVFHIADT